MNLLRKFEHNPSQKFPGFFKVYIGSMSCNALHISPSFVAHMNNLLPKKPILKSPKGKCWTVDVEQVGEDMFFMDGWPKFVSDNKIEDGHFLVFSYNGDMTFNFLHFNLSLCQVLEGEERMMKKGSSSYSSVADQEEIFIDGLINRPVNPFFVTKLRWKKRNALHLPGDVMKLHNIKLPSTVMMIDEEGRRIYTKVLSWSDGRKWIIDGWKIFVRHNNLKEDDRCICEFLVNNSVEDSDEEEDEVFLKMTVIRAGSWLLK
ncbi:B3 domain-containing protein REM20-like [Impatiens glandulifera]|uniref:B3 domain-containing protein REM20-like n=1 Tax=Impatiens glandulifera TaxID=253017 RepID=UPI001FB0F7D1|nr:B3 domain-containing protein REM20-like [Impatiens glandulifera]